MDKIFIEKIANDIYTENLTSESYSDFHDKTKKAIIDNYEQFKQRFKSSFSHHYFKIFFLYEKGEGCKKSKEYKEGYNDAVKELKTFFDEQEPNVKKSIERAFLLLNDQLGNIIIANGRVLVFSSVKVSDLFPKWK